MGLWKSRHAAATTPRASNPTATGQCMAQSANCIGETAPDSNGTLICSPCDRLIAESVKRSIRPYNT